VPAARIIAAINANREQRHLDQTVLGECRDHRTGYGQRQPSEVTVKSHIGRIFVKLELRDRAAAIVYAYDHGVVTP
jgi:hypothetical protein